MRIQSFIFTFIFIGIILPLSLGAQDIYTIAGDTAGYFGDGGPATAAELNYPSSTAIDSGNRNLFITDYSNSRIRKINLTTNIITTVAGNGISGYNGDSSSAISSELFDPEGIAVDFAGNLYIADSQNSRIRKVNTNGIISTIAGTGVAGYSGDGGFAVNAEVAYPFGMAVDTSGNIYFSDVGDLVIRKIAKSTGVINTIAGTGNFGYTGNDSAATNCTFEYPAGIALDGSGNIYVADHSTNTIRMISASDSKIYLFAGNGVQGFYGDGGSAIAAELTNPFGVAVDNAGNVFVTDSKNYRIREIYATSDIITTIAGNGVSGFSGDTGPAIAAELNTPEDVTVNNNTTSIYIADTWNQRIREFQYFKTTGINELKNSDELVVFPNPSNTNFYIQESSGNQIAMVEVFSITGQQIRPSLNPLNKQTICISTNDLQNGIYFVHLLMHDGRIIIKKIEVMK